MRFLRLNQGKGIFRPRSALEGALNDDEQGDSGNGTSKGSYGNMVLEVRGGSILFEPGAEGGSFVGIYFVGEEPSAASVEKAINQSLGRVSIRVYGGRVSVNVEERIKVKLVASNCSTKKRIIHTYADLHGRREDFLHGLSFL